MRIRSHILFWLLLLVILPMAGAGLYLYRGNCARLELAADLQQQQVGEHVVSDLDAVLRRTLEGTLVAAKNPLFADYLVKGGQGTQGEVVEVERALYQSVINDSFMVRSYALLDARGRKVVETNPALSGLDETGSEWVLNCLQESLPVFVPDFDDGRGGIWVCAPVRDGRGSVVGVLRLRYDLAILQQVVAKYSGSLQRGRFALLVDKQGRVLAHGYRREAVGTILSGAAELLPGASWAEGERVDAAGAGMCRQLVFKLRQAPWLAVLAEPRDIHEEALMEIKNLMWLLGGLALLLLLASAVLVSRITSSPIAKLAQVSQGIEAGNLNVVFAERGPTEVRMLAHSFNAMTARLRTALEDLEGKMAALQESERLLDEYIDASPVAIVVTDGQGRFLHINRMFTQLFGFTGEDLPGVSEWWAKAYPDIEYRTAIEREWTLRVEEARSHGGAVRPLEGLVFCKDGSQRQIEFHARTIAGSVLVLFTDLTERTRAAEEQRRLEDQLRQVQKLEAVGTMAGGVAHDFNNILLALLGNAQLAYEDLEEGHPSKESLAEVLVAGERATELVGRLLTFTRKVELKPRPVDLAPVLEEAVKLLKVSVPVSVRPELVLGAEVPEVLCDPNQIHRIVLGLASNAVHAMRGHGGVLGVALERARPSDEELGRIPGLRSAHTVRICVSDTGEGMSEETLDRLFEPFFTTKPMGEGTGLGLASAREQLQAFGGVISVESRPGEGSCFTVHLPGVETPVAASAEETVAQEEQARGRAEICVAIVDDEDLVRSMLERMVQRMGYQVAVFAEGNALLRRLRAEPKAFSLVLSDLSMPGMSGLELALEIRKLCPEVPVVLATGNSSRLERPQLEAAGVSGLVDKPFSRAELEQVIGGLV